MQVLRAIDRDTAALVGWGVRVLLLSPDAGGGPDRTAERIAGFGGRIEAEADLFAAVEAVAADATGFALFVMECDAYGGLDAGRNAVALLGRTVERTQVILISAGVQVQTFPEERTAPILLRAPLSAVALRVGFEHAMRDRLVYRAA